MKLTRITDIAFQDGYVLTLSYSDGAQATVDLAPLLQVGPVFAPLLDPDFFRTAQIGPRGRTLAWSGDLELDADSLRMAPEESGAAHRLLAFRPAAEVNPVSAAVAQALARSGLSQTEVAQRMGTTQSVVSRMADPAYFGHSVPTLQRFAQAVGAGLRVDFGEVERSA